MGFWGPELYKLTNGILRWAVNKIMNANHSYRYNSEIDYYAGHVVGDILSIGGGIGGIIGGIKTILASVAGGGGIVVGSGGLLSLGGEAIVVNGVIAGTANKYKLNKEQQRQLHEEASGQNNTYKEILEIA